MTTTTRKVTPADRARAATAAMRRGPRIRITPGQARAITEGITGHRETTMTLATLIAAIVLVFAILLTVGFFPLNNVVVGLLIGALAGAFLVGRL